MLPVSEGFLAALGAPQRVSILANVSKAGRRLASDLPVTSGSVAVDVSSTTRRRLRLTLGPRLRTGVFTDAPTLPRSPTDPLGHFGQEIDVSWSMHYVGGMTETLPLGVFRVDGASGSLLGDTSVQVTGVSREAFVADARFTSPRTASSPSAQALIAQLIHEVLPSVEVVALASMDRRVPTTTWDRDRWGAIVGLARSIGAVVFADPWGRFVIADAPTVATPPVWRVQGGPGGVLVSAATSSTRRGIYNAIVVRGESTQGDGPSVQAVARDVGPDSPTRWGDPGGGAFGMVPRFMSLPSLSSVAQAEAIARAAVTRYLGAASTMNLRTVPNPALEGGDVIDVITDPTDPAGSGHRHVLDSFTIPLIPGGDFPVATRDLRGVVLEVTGD